MQTAIMITAAIIHRKTVLVVIFLFGDFAILCDILSSPTIGYLLFFLGEDVLARGGLQEDTVDEYS